MPRCVPRRRPTIQNPRPLPPAEPYPEITILFQSKSVDGHIQVVAGLEALSYCSILRSGSLEPAILFQRRSVDGHIQVVAGLEAELE